MYYILKVRGIIKRFAVINEEMTEKTGLMKDPDRITV